MLLECLLASPRPTWALATPRACMAPWALVRRLLLGNDDSDQGYLWNLQTKQQKFKNNTRSDS